MFESCGDLECDVARRERRRARETLRTVMAICAVLAFFGAGMAVMLAACTPSWPKRIDITFAACGDAAPCVDGGADAR